MPISERMGGLKGPDVQNVETVAERETVRTDERWFVLRTKSRQEKIVATDINAIGARHYLPLVRRARYYGRRKTYVDLPLFPGYVFLLGDVEQAYWLDRRQRLSGIIDVFDQETLEGELRNIRTALSEKASLNPHPYLREGIRVEVRSGPFRGIQGVVAQVKKNDRLVLQVSSFGGAVSLEIDGALLERVC